MKKARRVFLTVTGSPMAQPRQKFRARIPGREDIRDMFEAAVNEFGVCGPVVGGSFDFLTAIMSDDRIWRSVRSRLQKSIRAEAYFDHSGPGENETPQERAERAKDAIRAAWKRSGESKFTGPVGLRIVVFLPRPASRTKKTRPNPREWDQRSGGVGGDWDNFGKLVSDALNTLAFDDDKQVAVGTVCKVMVQPNEEPRVEVMITELGSEVSV